MNLITDQAKGIPISKLEEIWRSLHPYARSEKQDQSIHAAFRRFTNFIAGKRQFVHEVTLQDVSTFCTSISQQFAHSTVKRIKSILKCAFDGALPPWAKNFFALLKLPRVKNAAVIHRRPLSEAEIERLFAEAKKNPLIYSLTISLACTGLRLADACLLRWDSVDLAKRVIEVTTRKTGAQVVVPILPPFHAVLESALAEKKDDDEFVFPGAARLYKERYSTLIRMGKLLFAHALFADEAKHNNVNSLLRLTRQKREVGRKSASTHGWHTLRTTFVTLTSIKYDVPIEMTQFIVGHATKDMTRTYCRPTTLIVAETMRRQLARSVLGGAATALPCEIEDQRFIESTRSPTPWPQSYPAPSPQATTTITLSIPSPFSTPKMSKPPRQLTPNTIRYTIPAPIHAPLRQSEPQMPLIHAIQVK